MFVRARPGYKADAELLMRAGRLGSRAALPGGAYAGLSAAQHLLMPSEKAVQLQSADAFSIRDPEELEQVAAYRSTVMSSSFGAMDAVRQRARALRAGLATGQDDAEWLRKDVHGLYVARTAFHPMLSDPAAYSEMSVGRRGGGARSKASPSVGTANPLAMLKHGMRGGDVGAPAATPTASAKRGGYGATLKARVVHGQVKGDDADDEDAGAGGGWCACCGCLCSCCFYAFCCCICALCCSKWFQKVAKAQRALGKKWRHRNDAKSPEEAELLHMINTAPALVQNNTLAHFLDNDYKAVYFYYRHLNMLVLLALSVTVVFFAAPESQNVALLKFFITFLVVSSVVVSMVYKSPFLDNEKWKENVKVYSLTLAVTAGLMNYVTFMEGELSVFPLGRNGGRNLAVLVFIMSMGLFLTLLTSFWRVLIMGAEAEAKAFARRKRRLQRTVVDLPEERHVRYQAGGNPMVFRTLQDKLGAAGGKGSGGGGGGPASSAASRDGAGHVRRARMSVVAQSMMKGGKRAAGRRGKQVRSGGGEKDGPTSRLEVAGKGSVGLGGDGESGPGALNPGVVGAQMVRRERASVTPLAIGQGAEKWRAAYATAAAQLSVMSGRERQQILRDAARERAYAKRKMW